MIIILKVLVACEESQRVCGAFRKRGCEAYSADLMDCSGGHPEWHIQGDVIPIINGHCSFKTNDGAVHNIDGEWDLIIAHPPCTKLTNSGNWLFNIDRFGDKARQRYKDREEAFAFFMKFINANCKHIAVENPVGYLNTHYRKPDCYYHPYDFIGEKDAKKTCLWLKGLPPLLPTREVPLPKEERSIDWYNGHFGNRIVSFSSSESKILRSKTPVGVAEAMAEQWIEYLAKQ